MATIVKYLSKVPNVDGRCEIYLRITVSRNTRFKVHSGLFVDPARFSNGTFKKPRVINDEYNAIQEIERRISDIEDAIMRHIYTVGTPTKESIDKVIADFHKPKRQYKKRPDKADIGEFFGVWGEFMKSKSSMTEHWLKQYEALARALHRYELWKNISPRAKYTLSLSNLDVNDFTYFYRNEPDIYENHPEIYNDYPAHLRPLAKDRRPAPRGDNMIADIVKKLSAFLNWCVNTGHISRSPMKDYKGVTEERYGKPVYLNIEERDKIASFDLSDRPALARQRDVFIFQCHVGCRVGDLYSFTRDNIVGEYLEYIPGKTKKDSLDAIRVPLTSTAKAIIDRYKHEPTMLPLISQQKYNIAIKDVLKVCGIDRVVTVINPTTGKDERKPIWQVASSHMARRVFIGNLYKKVKDQNLVGALSGHVEGSRAFARYRDIDDDIRREVMNFLE